MNINYQDIHNTDLSHLMKVVSKEHRHLVNGHAGRQHYTLLAWLSRNLTGLIVELGTHYGTSSMALAENKSNVIITYDIRDIYTIKRQPKNVIRKIGNIFSLGEETFLKKADLIFVDTAHTGVFEWQVYSYLKNNDYRGILLLDDILWSDEMIGFWKKIDTLKYDITDIGHGGGLGPKGNISGTGLVDFGGKVRIIKTPAI
jgi:predicted O-methyltransferase YrrM